MKKITKQTKSKVRWISNKTLVLILFSVFFSFFNGKAQTALPYIQDFEGAQHGWVLSNGTSSNKWFVGTAVSNTGTKSLYISDDNGISNHYNTGSSVVVHAYKDFNLASNVQDISLEFDWMAMGEGSSWDYLRVLIVPSSFTPTVGTLVSTSSDRIDLFGNLLGNSSFKREQIIQDISNYSGSFRIVFEWKNDSSGGTQPPAAIDNIEITAVTCYQPIGAVITEASPTSANVVVTPDPLSSNGVSYEYEVRTSGAPGSGSTGLIVSGSSSTVNFIVNGLIPTVIYNIYIRTVCNTTEQSVYSSYSFVQAPTPLPYIQDFEGAQHGWVLSNGTSSNKWFVGTAVASTGTKSLYISDDNGITNHYNTGSEVVVHAYKDFKLDANVQDISLEFDWVAMGEGSSWDYLRVLIVPSSFTPTVGTLVSTSSDRINLFGNLLGNPSFKREQIIQDISNYSGSFRIVFEWKNDSSGGTQPPATIDNIEIKSVTCYQPLDMVFSNITQTDVTVTLTPDPKNLGNVSYEYEIRTSGIPGSGSIGLVTTGAVPVPNFTISGLPTSTTYQIYVRTSCSSTNHSFWTSDSFTTLCPTFVSNFSENFDTTSAGTTSLATYPLCWNYINTISSSGYGYVINSTANAQSGSQSFRLYRTNSTSNSSQEIVLVSPETDDLGDGTKQLRFSVRSYDTTNYLNKLEVLSLSGNASTANATVLATLYPDHKVYREYVVVLPQTTDDYFAFRLAYNGTTTGSSIVIDDVYYEDVSPCIFPTNISVSQITSNTATVSWNPSTAQGVTRYYYEVRTSGFPESGSVGLISSGHVVGTSVNITGLSMATQYYVYVRSICGLEVGSWNMIPGEFMTICGVVSGNFFENFDTTTAGSTTTATQPFCWSLIDNITTTGYGYVIDSGANAKSGTKSFRLYRTNTTTNSNQEIMLISPETVNLGNGAKQLRFSVRSYDTTNYLNYLEIVRLNGNGSTAVATVLDTIYPDHKAYQEYVVALPQTADDFFGFRLAYNGGTTASSVVIDDVYYEDIPPLSIAITDKVDILCNGNDNGSITVEAFGGVQPYTYTWTPSVSISDVASDLSSGDYKVTVTDAKNESVDITITITEPDILQSHLISTNITCNGNNNGSATVSPTGGVAPYTILWSDGKVGASNSNLIPGAYSVTIRDANHCLVTESFTINEPSVLTTSIGNQVNVSAYGGNDGSATINVTGGTAPYTYSWLPFGGTGATASNLTAGTYTVDVMDANGCVSKQTVVITQPQAPFEITLVSLANVTCNGQNNGSIVISVTGEDSPFTYAWSPSGGTGAVASNLTAGSYTVLVTNSIGQTITDTYVISEPTVLTATVGAIVDATCFGGNNGSATVTPSGGTVPYSFVWSNGETTATAYNLTAGSHFVNVTDSNGCVTQQVFNINQSSALNVSASNLVDVTCNGLANGSITVMVNGGVAPYAYTWNTGQSGNILTNLSGGVYTVTVTDVNNCTEIKSFTVLEPAVVHPPIAVNQNFCTNATLSDMVITGGNIKWYDAAVNGNVLGLNTPLVNGNVYYASQTINGCESSYRTPVQVSLYQPVPLTTTSLNVCNNTIIQDVVIDGNGYTQLKWYNNSTSTVALSANHLLTSGTYYVSTFTSNTCESVRYPVQISILASVPAPVVGAQTVCGMKTFNDLVITKVPGGVINWYASAQSVTPITLSNQVLSGTYYVEQVVGSCKSVRVAVPVQVISITSPNITNITVCNGTTIGDFNNEIAPIKYVWYSDSTTMTPLADTYVIQTGSYYVAEEKSGCISNRTMVNANVNPRPANPTGQVVQSFGFAATVANLKMNQTGVEWYGSYNDAVSLSNQLSGSTLLQDGESYYAIIRGVNNCPSYPTEVKVVINLGTSQLDLTYLKYYPNPTDSVFNIEYNEVIKKIEIYTITGQKVLTKEFNDRQIKLDLSGYSSGTYMVRIETEKASQFIKIVKK